MNTKQPDALRLANEAMCKLPNNDGAPIAAELRRLHEVNAELLEACETFAHWLATEENHELMPDFWARVELCNLAQKQARAAIAKATGAQS